MKKTMASLLAAILLVALFGCAAQMADKTAWDEQTQKTLKAEEDARRERRIMGP